MISIGLILISLLIAFIEKKDLFRRPIKTWSWMIIILMFIGAAAEIKEKLDDGEQVKKANQGQTDILTAINKIDVMYDPNTKIATITNINSNNKSVIYKGNSGISLNANRIDGVKIDGVTTKTTINELLDKKDYKIVAIPTSDLLFELRNAATKLKIANKQILIYYIAGTNGTKWVDDVQTILTGSEFTTFKAGFIFNNNPEISKGISVKTDNGQLALILGNLGPDVPKN